MTQNIGSESSKSAAVNGVEWSARRDGMARSGCVEPLLRKRAACALFAIVAGCGLESPLPPQGLAGSATRGAIERGHRADPPVVRPPRQDSAPTIDELQARKAHERLTLRGSLELDQRTTVEVRLPVTARVVRLFVARGDDVRGGQALADLESPEALRARSEYIAAVARHALVEAALHQTRQSASGQQSAKREIEAAQALVEEASAALRAATAALNTMGLSVPTELNGERSSSLFLLRSPGRGTVITQRAVQGQMLHAGAVALRVSDLSVLWLTVEVAGHRAEGIRTGLRARVSSPALSGETFEGVVTRIGRRASAASPVDIRIEVRNRDHLLRPGMSAAATLSLGREVNR